MITLDVNGKRLEADVDPSTPLLWVLRDALGLTGTKYGCGMAQCGACTVHLVASGLKAEKEFCNSNPQRKARVVWFAWQVVGKPTAHESLA